MANAVERGSNSNGYDGGGGGVRPPRLPRWTRQEILVLIQGKRVVEGRGRGRGRTGSNRTGPIGAGLSPVEPKWAAVAAYCRRHGVNRGPVQCRKRWSNLAGDYKKIKEWEKGKEGKESFWVMRNDLRRERRLPGFFDREVYDILDGVVEVEVEVEEVEVEEKGKRKEEEEEEVVFDSGRGAGDDGLFSDFDEDEKGAAVAVLPLSEKKFEPSQQENPEPGTSKDKQPAYDTEKDSPSQEGQKRRRMSQEGVGETELQSQLIEVLERNSRMLTAQLEAQNMNCQLDRDQRKEQANSLLGVLSKLADALGRIADKL